MTLHPLDVVVLRHDLPAHGLMAGDLGAVAEVYGPDAADVEFVADQLSVVGPTRLSTWLRR